MSTTKRGLKIEKGKRHCKIVDRHGEVVFRTTNLRDAEHYLELCEENDRLLHLMEARGMAPHRIYLLAADEEKRGRANVDKAAANEVVIVAKAEDGVVVRHLSDGHEEIVDLEEIEPIEGGSYLQASEIHDEAVNLVIRFDREAETVSVAAFHDADNANELFTSWSRAEEPPGSEYLAALAYAEGDVLIYRTEATLDD